MQKETEDNKAKMICKYQTKEKTTFHRNNKTVLSDYGSKVQIIQTGGYKSVWIPAIVTGKFFYFKKKDEISILLSKIIPKTPIVSVRGTKLLLMVVLY